MVPRAPFLRGSHAEEAHWRARVLLRSCLPRALGGLAWGRVCSYLRQCWWPPAVHLAVGAASTRHLRYLIPPLRLQPSLPARPHPRAPKSSVGLTSPGAFQSPAKPPNSWECHGGGGSPTAGLNLAAVPTPRARCGLVPAAPLSRRFALSIPASIRQRQFDLTVGTPMFGPPGFRVTAPLFPSRIWKPSRSA